MYRYFEKAVGQPVYICIGEEAAEFKKDVEALGLFTEVLENFEKPVVLAVDPLESDRHMLALNIVKGEIVKYGGLGPDVEESMIDGPFPEIREFPIYTTWEMWGRDVVAAKTLQDAMDKAIEDLPLPEGNYVSDSQVIDYEATLEI